MASTRTGRDLSTVLIALPAELFLKIVSYLTSDELFDFCIAGQELHDYMVNTKQLAQRLFLQPASEFSRSVTLLPESATAYATWLSPNSFSGPPVRVGAPLIHPFLFLEHRFESSFKLYDFPAGERTLEWRCVIWDLRILINLSKKLQLDMYDTQPPTNKVFIEDAFHRESHKATAYTKIENPEGVRLRDVVTTAFGSLSLRESDEPRRVGIQEVENARLAGEIFGMIAVSEGVRNRSEWWTAREKWRTGSRDS